MKQKSFSVRCAGTWIFLSVTAMAKLMREQDCQRTIPCVFRWVQVYSPGLNKRCRPCLRRTNKSYRVDETYTKVGGESKYLYRAVDSRGQTIDFLLTAKRDAAGGEALLSQSLSVVGQCLTESDQT